MIICTLFGRKLCFLPKAQGPEIIGEVADLLVRCEGTHQVLCAAVVGNDLFLSVRTEDDQGDASQLVRDTIAGPHYLSQIFNVTNACNLVKKTKIEK